MNVAEYPTQPEKWVDVDWEKDINGEFSANIRLEITNQRGALATIAATIADQGANIENVEMADRDDRYVAMAFTIAVRDRLHLARVIRSIRKIKHVARVSRTR